MIQKQPSGWSCLPTSLAIVLKCPVQGIFEYLGHDGSAIVFPQLPDPERRRSFHIQEMIDFADSEGMALVGWDSRPTIGPYNSPLEIELYSEEECHRKLNHYIRTHDGILTGFNAAGRPHAMAWTNQTVVDPALGSISTLIGFSLQTFYYLSKSRA